MVYSEGQWAGKASSDRYLALDIHDSDIAIVVYRPVFSGSGLFYLGYEPREYFDDPSASAPIDRTREARAFSEWAATVLRRELPSEALASLLAVPGTEPDDTVVEETVVRLLNLLGLPIPSALVGSAASNGPTDLASLSEQDLKSRLGLPT